MNLNTDILFEAICLQYNDPFYSVIISYVANVLQGKIKCVLGETFKFCYILSKILNYGLPIFKSIFI